MILRFELTMPNNNSWNGVDTGNKGGYYIFRNVDKKTCDKLDGKSFYYNFGDGWGASVLVSKNRKTKSNGFRGYNWMVDEIIKYGTINNVNERRLKNKLESEFKKFAQKFIEENNIKDTETDFLFEGIEKIFREKMYMFNLK